MSDRTYPRQGIVQNPISRLTPEALVPQVQLLVEEAAGEKQGQEVSPLR